MRRPDSFKRCNLPHNVLMFEFHELTPRLKEWDHVRNIQSLLTDWFNYAAVHVASSNNNLFQNSNLLLLVLLLLIEQTCWFIHIFVILEGYSDILHKFHLPKSFKEDLKKILQLWIDLYFLSERSRSNFGWFMHLNSKSKC